MSFCIGPKKCVPDEIHRCRLTGFVWSEDEEYLVANILELKVLADAEIIDGYIG